MNGSSSKSDPTKLDSGYPASASHNPRPVLAADWLTENGRCLEPLPNSDQAFVCARGWGHSGPHVGVLVTAPIVMWSDPPEHVQAGAPTYPSNVANE